MIYFPNKVLEKNPKVIIRVNHVNRNDFSYITKKLGGSYYRVIPQCAKEVMLIRSLLKNVYVFTPEEGDGVLIDPNML